MEDVLVPIVLFSVLPVCIWLVSLFNYKKRLTAHETVRHAIDSGQTISPELIEKMSLLVDPIRADLRRGVLFIAFGCAFAVLGMVVGQQEGEAVMPMIGVASFPVFLGLAYLGLWKFGHGSKAA
ncbi:DUF6249 domain-containing protein [Hyphomonas oceanitis]|uniref:DUF6249 domain-containing protein n=1 Tax=Hyphomonas oceanitis SCH89 TaxID=1280953 RepID=A0A059G887_9PROT|nr:DUF6249 domain-containing protein [Hyphomonas oceanitis]KDA02909.1 hypothetical protein HOC_08187 [Hyphomonas oceanitis SCH89]